MKSTRSIGIGRILLAGFFALMFLAMVIPCTGRIVIDHTATSYTSKIVDRPKHIAILLGVVAVPLSCIFIGAKRSSGLELFGWLALIFLLILPFFKGGM
jgi:hypothetical protein